MTKKAHKKELIEQLRRLVLSALPLTLHHCNPDRNSSDDELILLKLYLKRMVKIGKEITRNHSEFMRIKQAINIFCKSSTTTNRYGRPTLPAFVDCFVEEIYRTFCFKSSREYFREHEHFEHQFYQFIKKGAESLEEYLEKYRETLSLEEYILTKVKK